MQLRRSVTGVIKGPDVDMSIRRRIKKSLVIIVFDNKGIDSVSIKALSKLPYVVGERLQLPVK